MALSSTSRPSIRLKAGVKIPASFEATGGLKVTKANGRWTLEPDFSLLSEIETLTTPNSKQMWVYDPVTGDYNVLTIGALGGSLFSATSSTSVTIGTGEFVFVTQEGKLLPVGSTVVITSDADPTVDYLVAQVTAYTGTSLTVEVPVGGNHGSGAHTDWTISLVGSQGNTATVEVGTTDTLAEGASATVDNSGTAFEAVLDFGIPRGPIPATGFNFSTTTTDSDPGAGNVRFNNATPASVTAIYFDNADRDGNAVTAWLDSFDDSTNTAKGTLIFTAAATPAVKLIFAVSGTVVDGTGYRKVTVTHVAGTTLPSNAAHLAVMFARAGDKGTDGAGTGDVVGPASSVDSRMAEFSGTSGKLLKDGGVVVSTFAKTLLDDANAAAALTTLTARGQGRETISVPAAAMFPRVSNPCASIATTETTTNKINYRTLDFDGSSAEVAQFAVPMPKSWDEGQISYEVLWTAASGSGGVVWIFDAIALSNDDGLDSVAFGPNASVTDTLITAGDLHISPESSAFTVAGTPAAGDLVYFQISRNPAAGGDTLAVDAKLIAIRIFFNTNAATDA